MEQDRELRALTVKVPEATYKAVRKLSVEWGITNSGVIIQAIATLERRGLSAFDAPPETTNESEVLP
jgi:hypothetical protein